MLTFGYNVDGTVNTAQANVVEYIFELAWAPGLRAKFKADNLVYTLNQMFHDISPNGLGWRFLDVLEVISNRRYYDGSCGTYPPILTASLSRNFPPLLQHKPPI